MGLDIASHNRSCSDHSVLSNCDSAEDSCIGSNGCPAADSGRSGLPSDIVRTRKAVVCKDRRRPDKDIIFNLNASENGDEILDMTPAPDDSVMVDIDTHSELGASTNDGTGPNVGKVPEEDATADLGTFVNHRGGMNAGRSRRWRCRHQGADRVSELESRLSRGVQFLLRCYIGLHVGS